jgi:hypothetical protein
MDKKALLKMSAKQVRDALALKMGVEPSELPMKALVREMEVFIQMNMSERNKLYKIGTRMRRKEPKRYYQGVTVSKAPIRFKSNSNSNSN